jgi:hypothetical protein
MVQTTFDYLTFINQALGSNMSSAALTNLILLHEFGHTPAGGNRPDDSQFDVVQYDKDIYNDCIK